MDLRVKGLLCCKCLVRLQLLRPSVNGCDTSGQWIANLSHSTNATLAQAGRGSPKHRV